MSHAERRVKLAGEIRAELARQDKSQAELALAIGCSPATVSRILKAQRNIGLEQSEAIAKFLGFTLSELISRRDAA